jgi:DNA-binding CsgD family transcriptional regulator
LDTHRRSEYFNDYEKPQDRIHVLGSTLKRQGSELLYVGLHRGLHSAGYSEHDLALLRVLLPHLSRALQLRGFLAQADEARLLGEGTLEQLRIGVVIVDADARLRYANGAAQTILNSRVRTVYVGCGEKLACALPSDTARLLQSIAHASMIASNARIECDGSLDVKAADGLTTARVHICPLSRLHTMRTSSFPRSCAAVFLSLAYPIPLPWRSLMTQYGLTASEARLASALALGASIQEAACRFAVSIHTVRSQLNAIFGKTNTQRQGELISKLLSSALAEYAVKGDTR